MKKKVFILMLSVAVFYGSMVSSASAVGVDTALKIVAGTQTKQLVRGIAEETGMVLSTRQFDNVVGHLNKRANDGDVKVIDWIDKTTVINPSTVPSEKGTGWKKYTLDPLLWVTGADLILEAVDAFNDGYENGTPVDVYENTDVWLENPGFPYQVVLRYIPTGYDWLYVSKNVINVEDGEFSIKLTSETNLERYGKNESGVWVMNGASSSVTESKTQYELVGISGSPVVKSKQITAEDYYDYSISNISSSTKTNYDNDTYINTVNNDYSDDDISNDVITYKMELDLPDDTSDTKTRDMSTFWNVEDSTITGGTFYVFDSGGGDVSIGDGSGGSGSGGDGVTVNNNINVDLDADDEIIVPRNFFTSLTYMGEKVGDMYDGVTHFFSKSVEGFKSLTDGMVGFTSFLDSFFDWLPTEYKTLLGAGFTLGVVSFFLRR